MIPGSFEAVVSRVEVVSKNLGLFRRGCFENGVLCLISAIGHKIVHPHHPRGRAAGLARLYARGDDIVAVGRLVHLFSAIDAGRHTGSKRVADPKAVTTAPDANAERIPGSGHFGVQVVGESRYQRALEDAAGGRTHGGVWVKVEALLVLEDENRYDENAVRVDVSGETVGYLDRETAVRFRERYEESARQSGGLVCKAEIRGGWDRGEDDRGSFGIVLDFPRDF